MEHEQVVQKCGELGSDQVFIDVVKAFNEAPPVEPPGDWPEAEAVYRLLSRDMQNILRKLAVNKPPIQYKDQSIECLKTLDIIQAGQDGRLSIVKGHFGSWIIQRHRSPLRSPWNRRPRPSAFYPQDMSKRVWLAFALLCIPIAVMLPPLLGQIDLFKPRMNVIQLQEFVGIFRNLAIYLVIMLVGFHLFSRFGRESGKGSFLAILSIPLVVTLMVFWLGFPTYLVVLFAAFSILDLWALHLLFQAHQTLPNIPDDLENKRLRKLLEDTIKPNTWNDMTQWPELKIILMLFLSLTGFMFFGALLAPREYDLQDPTGLTEYTLIAPSWLSYRDEGTILVAVRANSTVFIAGTILLEPEARNLISVVPSDKERCSPGCSWGPLASTNHTLGRNTARSSESTQSPEYEVLEWHLYTAPRRILPSESAWQLRVSLCAKFPNAPSPSNCKDQIVSLSKIRIGFRMWGLLDEQPLVNVLSVIFGLVYAIVQIWISNLLIGRPMLKAEQDHRIR